MTNEQLNLKRGRKLKGSQQKISINNWGKMRDRDRDLHNKKGRVTKPDQKYVKQKRQTVSSDAYYHHVKYHEATTTGTMCSL